MDEAQIGHNVDPDATLGLEQEPALGAHLTTSRRGYSHHGVYVGRGRVVHYSGLSGFWHCGPVEEVSLSRFANGRAVRVVDHLEPAYQCVAFRAVRQPTTQPGKIMRTECGAG